MGIQPTRLDSHYHHLLQLHIPLQLLTRRQCFLVQRFLSSGEMVHTYDYTFSAGSRDKSSLSHLPIYGSHTVPPSPKSNTDHATASAICFLLLEA